MLQGTGTDVGKSLLVAGLCRAYTLRGMRVRPFKPQNMSNNAAVTRDGGEIGRAQALQARACRTAPVNDMNPVLLKPQTDVGSQVVVQGEVYGNVRASQYYQLKPKLMPRVLESFERLRDDADLILVEGAGSASEVNLRAGDIANMGFALATGTPVALVGDIDRGGVIASLVGTMSLLSEAERELLCGYIINRFRGDISLFDSGIEVIGGRTGLSCLGVVSYFQQAGELPAEDSVGIGDHPSPSGSKMVVIAVPVFLRIANFDDLDPLIAEPDVDVRFIKPGQALPGDADLVILPGSKATIADLKFVRAQGWHIDLQSHLRRGGWVLGLCGGYQMLGRSVADPNGIEGQPESVEGLGLLEVDTVLAGRKQLKDSEGTETTTGTAVYGYEIHLGTTTGQDTDRPMLELSERRDGAISSDRKVMGCYLHGLFSSDEYRHAFLKALGRRSTSGLAYEHRLDEVLDGLAAQLERQLDLDELFQLSQAKTSKVTATSAPAIK